MFIGRAFNYSRIYPRNTIINDEEEHEDEYEVRLRFFASFLVVVLVLVIYRQIAALKAGPGAFAQPVISLYLTRRTPSSKAVEVIRNSPISAVDLTWGPIQGQWS